MAIADSKSLARRIAGVSLTKKALDVRMMNLKPLTGMTDYFVICHGESDAQVRAIADAIDEGLRKDGVRWWHREGYNHCHWILLDYVDVVVHIFQKQEREYFGLERLWGDAATETVTDQP
jgi:ribosome-associated protein